MAFLPIAVLLLAAACDGNGTQERSRGEGAAAARPRGFVLQEVARGLEQPVQVAAAPGDRSRVFVVERPGRILVVHGDRLLPQPFLDITDRVASGAERGLLSVAFHPRYAENGYLYVKYTDAEGHTRVERYRASPAGADRVDPASAHPVLRVEQPFAARNGGLVAFGPDGMLYVGMGDGGGRGDPHGHGRDPGTLLGALLRIDVDGGDPYAIPPDNPFARGGGRPEVWATGLRHPWRFSFDREAGLLYLADVGAERQEVNVVPLTAAGLDYGWSAVDGSECLLADEACPPGEVVLPALEYGAETGCAVRGGYVYRGRAMPSLRGTYFYSDRCQGWLKSFRYDESGEVVERLAWPVGSLGNVSSFGEDANGELYVTTYGGRVLQFIPGL
jgi:glucose/arabinose dehydrogenase